MLGTGTKVIQGLKIGKNTMIGAGAVVISDIPDNCTAVGVPARVISTGKNEERTRG
jgi:UDP-perosamine 4-acetyltransferase